MGNRGPEIAHVRCEPDFRRDPAAFDQRLAESIAWAAARADAADPAGSLRRPDHRPRTFADDRFDLVRSMCHGRIVDGVALLDASLGGGRLLAYFPDLDLFDGAAEAETGGFFDVFNTPPWDTWVAYVEEQPPAPDSAYLIAWIPPVFLEIVSRGIEVNPEECIAWLADTDTRMAAWLRDRGWRL